MGNRSAFARLSQAGLIGVLGFVGLSAAIDADSGVDAPRLLGKISWADDSPEFGGFSGLALYDGGRAFYAVSDGGILVQADLGRDAGGQIDAVHLTDASRFKDNFGRPAIGFQSDAEAVRLAPDGSLLVSFEGYARVARFHLPDMMPVPLHEWDRFRSLWGNAGMEALAVGADGRIIAILEDGVDSRYRTLAYGGGTRWVDGPPLSSDGAFSATDADFGPDGQLYLLERSFSVLWGYQTRISTYAPDGAGFGLPRVVLLTAAGDWGDFEGMDVWTDAQGRTVATLIADDNFLPLSPTTIAEFDLTEKTGHSDDN